MIQQRKFAQINNPLTSSRIILPSLQPSTLYDIYCISRNSYGSVTPTEEMIRSRMSVVTLCCKSVVVTISEATFREDTVYANVISIVASGSPFPNTEVVLELKASSENRGGQRRMIPGSKLFYPSSIVLNSLTWSAPQHISLLSASAGDYTLIAEVKGENPYIINYGSRGAMFAIISIDTIPPIPVLSTATFSSNGLYIFVTFDSSTNLGYLSILTPFKCSAIFAFVGASSASCVWTASSMLTITPGGTLRVIPGHDLKVLSSTIRAQCTVNSDCSSWEYVSAERSIKFLSPVTKESPQVVIRFPSQVNPCDPVVLDLTSSTGSGGREWRVSIVVSGDDKYSIFRLNEFFNSSYTINTPVPIPRGFLRVNHIYDFQVTLCNFLDACGVGTSRLEVIDNGAPSITILGQQIRSIYTVTPLILQADVSIRSCNGSISTSFVSLTWMVYQEGVLNSSLVSVARDRLKFKLNSYSLTPLLSYRVVVVAANIMNQISARSFVDFTVSQSNLVALIKGGSTFNVRVGSTVFFDASASYDPDLPPALRRESTKQYSFQWNCYRSLPTLSEACELSLQYVNNGLQVQVQSTSAIVGSRFEINVIVMDPNTGRRSTSNQVSITLSSPLSPVVAVSSRSLKINPSDQLILYSNINSSYPVLASWIRLEDNQKIGLKWQSTMNTSCVLASGVRACNIILRPNSLIGRQAPYIFVLSVSILTFTTTPVESSIAITINTPPLPGTFSVFPTEGTGMKTTYFFASSLWTDDDLPLSYEYRYLNNVGLGSVLRSRSESTYTSSLLPVGSYSIGYGLTCQVRVFDNLNAHELKNNLVIVNPMNATMPMRDIATIISSQLQDDDEDVDNTKQSLSLALSLLNMKDCSKVAINCSSLNRQSCESGQSENSCGSCLEGFQELLNDPSVECFSQEEYYNNIKSLSSRLCSSHDDCNPWGFCDNNRTPSYCVGRSRQCSVNCSGHGSCVYMANNVKVNECLFGDISCQPVCECISGWHGDFCRLTEEDLLLRMTISDKLADKLISLVTLDEPSQDSIESWSSSLSSLSDIEALSTNSALKMVSVASTILEFSSTFTLDSATLSNVLDCLDTSSKFSGSDSVVSAQRKQLSSVTSPLSTILSAFDLYARLMTSSFVPGQVPVASIYSTFRFNISELTDESLTVTIPQSRLELVSDEEPSSVTMSGSVTLSAFSIDSQQYKYRDMVDYSSNPLRLVFPRSASDDFVITLRTTKSENYEIEEASNYVVVNTTCTVGDYKISVLPCPGGINISHHCNGTSMTLSTRCPVMQRIPSCVVLTGKGTNCSVESYTATHVNCRCHTIALEADHNARLLSTEQSALQDSGVLEVSSVTVLVGKQFFDTIETAQDLNSLSDLRKTLIVILMYSVLWSVGLLGILGCSYFQRYRFPKSGNAQALSLKKERAMLTRSNHDVKQYLMSYVNEVFPSVFQAKSRLERLWNEIKKHHRYLLLFSTSGDISESRRMLTGIQLLTVQSMLMFILAVCYDLQVEIFFLHVNYLNDSSLAMMVLAVNTNLNQVVSRTSRHLMYQSPFVIGRYQTLAMIISVAMFHRQ